MRAILLGAAATVVAGPALAAAPLNKPSAGHTYFYRQGATLEAHDADLRACRKQAFKTEQPDTSAGAGAGGGLIGALVVGIVKGVMDGMAERRGISANLENCMVVRGWDVVRLEPADGEAVWKLEQPGKAERLAALLRAEKPSGVVVRSFANEGRSFQTARPVPAGDLDKQSLGLLALAKATEPEPQPRKLPLMQRSAQPPKPLKPEQLKSVPATQGIVVVHVAGRAGDGGTGVTFARLGKDAETPAWVDNNPGAFSATLPVKWFGGKGETAKTLVYAVPPGRWGLSGLVSGLFTTSFCLGAPAFDVQAGEVVYAGAFAIDGESLGPVLALEPARTVLAAAPQLAERLRPAAWTNGHALPCDGAAYIYAMEVPEAPFAEGYAWGSKAPAADVAATAAAPAGVTPVSIPAGETAPATAPAAIPAPETTPAAAATPAG